MQVGIMKQYSLLYFSLQTGFNNCDYMAVFNNILLPIAYEVS